MSTEYWILNMIKKIKAWYEGEFIPYENNEDSPLIRIGGRTKRPLLAKIISNILLFFKVHGKSTIMALLALSAVLVALPSGITSYQKLIEKESQKDIKPFHLPVFSLLIWNDTKNTISINSIGNFQILADVSPMMNTIVANGRFIIGNSIGDKPISNYFYIKPGENINIDGKFLNQKLFKKYYESGDLDIRFLLNINENIIKKDGLLFNEDYLISELISISIKETHNKSLEQVKTTDKSRL